MTEDRLAQLRGRVSGLGDRPLAEHPDVLDDVHRRLVAELERLAGAGSSAAPTAEPGRRDEIETLIGELLFAIVDLSRRLRCDPELALRAASRRFVKAASADAP